MSMNDPSDFVTEPESGLFSSALRSDHPLDEDVGPVSLYQEINERRARLENAELLQHLRSL
jgi:hypothetical protein